MAYFETHTPRVPKIDAPLLVIGLGGTGADGLLRIKSEFAQRLIPDRNEAGEPLDRPPRTAYLEIDTDSNVLNKRYHGTKIDTDSEWIDLSCPIKHVLGDNGQGVKGVNLDPTIKIWLDRQFYTDQDLIDHAATDGAGTYRQLSRLMLFRKVTAVVNKLRTLMTRLSTVNPGAPVGKREINVVVCTGLSGGTGSGTFLDLAYLIRYAATLGKFPVKLNLYAVAPDVTINHHAVANPNSENIYIVNSFAAMKELDYWMAYNARQEPVVSQETYRVDYGSNIVVPWNSVPYDDVTLLCATNEQGALLQNAYHVVLNSMAEVLLFQMAGEAPKNQNDIVGQDAQDANDSFTFQSQRSNEHAYRKAISKAYPENYCYRTIGAFSTLGEQRSKVAMEADLIFRDVMSFSTAPEQMPVMNGRDPEVFCEPFQKQVAKEYSEFERLTAFNDALFSKLSPFSMNEIRQNGEESTPHGLYPEWERGIITAFPHLQNDMRERLFGKFGEMARDYIMSHGLNALEAMLSDPNTGFVKYLNGKVTSYRQQADDFHGQQIVMATDAKNAYNDFMSRGNGVAGLLDHLHALPQAFDNYLSRSRSMYEMTQSEYAMTAIANVLEELALDIRTQMVDKTIPYAKAALKQIGEQVADDVKNSTIENGAMHMIDLEGMRRDIQTTYEKEETRQAFIERVMTLTADVVLSTVDAQDEDSAMSYVISSLNGMIDNIFLAINDTTLASMLQGFGGINANGVADYIKQEIAPRLERGASAHFALTADYGNLNTSNAVLCSYISIPQNATEVKQGIKEYISSSDAYTGAVLKSSVISDRIFWMNVVAGLPLCAYAYMRDYESVYLLYKASRPGTHLVHVDQADLDRLGEERTVLNDWNLLPSPVPFKTLGARPVAPETQYNWEKAISTINDAMANDVLQFRTDGMDFGGYQARLLFFCGPNGQRKEAQETQLAFNRILSSGKDAPAMLSDLQQMMNERIAFSLSGDARENEPQAKRFASAEGDSGVFEMQEVRAKHYHEVINHRLSKRPGLLLEMDRQVLLQKPILEKINALKTEIQSSKEKEERAAKESEKAIQAVREVAELLTFGFVKLLMNGASYLDDMGRFKNEAGEPNILMNQQNTPFKGEAWANFIPLEVRLAIWYSQQDPEEEPLLSLRERCRELTRELENLEGTEDDVARVRGYRETAEGILETYPRKLTMLKGHNKDIPKTTYDMAVKALAQLKQSLEGITAPWLGI